MLTRSHKIKRIWLQMDLYKGRQVLAFMTYDPLCSFGMFPYCFSHTQMKLESTSAFIKPCLPFWFRFLTQPTCCAARPCRQERSRAQQLGLVLARMVPTWDRFEDHSEISMNPNVSRDCCQGTSGGWTVLHVESPICLDELFCVPLFLQQRCLY